MKLKNVQYFNVSFLHSAYGNIQI